MNAHSCMKPVLIVAAAIAFLLPDSGLRAGDLGNLSTRGSVGGGDDVLIGGIIVTGNSSKRVILRAISPPLGEGALQDPILDLHESTGNILQTNDDWRYGPELEIEASQLAPAGDYDSTIIAVLAPGNYTAITRGYALSTGIALVEAYDPDPASGSRLAQMSTRGNVRMGNDILIGGFIVLNSATRVLLRAIGPELTAFNISSALQNPILELRDGNGALIEANDDWKSDNQQAISATGIPPTDDRESAIVRNLVPGSYTALVRGKNNSTGIALVEIYRLP
jgi:hypothetical protein